MSSTKKIEQLLIELTKANKLHWKDRKSENIYTYWGATKYSSSLYDSVNIYLTEKQCVLKPIEASPTKITITRDNILTLSDELFIAMLEQTIVEARKGLNKEKNEKIIKLYEELLETYSNE